MDMRISGKWLNAAVAVIMMASFAACDDTETYAEQKAKERKTIEEYIADNHIDVITADEFLKDTVTNNPFTGPDFSKNEFVLFPDEGVYVQIIRRGTGKPIQAGETKMYNVRYVEYSLQSQDTISMNLYNQDPDVMSCKRTVDTYQAMFKSGVMIQCYNSSVPKGWLVPIKFLKPGFYNGEPSAKVRLIVPHDQGTSNAAQSVYACLYELTLTPQKWQ